MKIKKKMTSMNGIPLTDTKTLTAIGDSVQNEREIPEFDFSIYDDFTDEEGELIMESVPDLIYSAYKDIDAITMEDVSMTDTTLTIILFFDYTGDNTALVEAGFLSQGLFESEDGYISFTNSRQNPEVQGYRVITE